MRLVLLTTFFGLFLNAFGQKPFYFIENGIVQQIDTVSLFDVENYGLDDFVLNLGNHGSPELRLKPELKDFITNDYSFLTYQPVHSFKWYKLNKPMVDARYIVGSGKEQHFNLVHSQNITPNVNYAIGLNKINSNGLYLNQSTNYTDIFFNAYGENLLKKKYNFGLAFNFKNAASSLNGGLEDDSTFINDTLDLQNRELLDINLPFAYQEVKKWYGNFGHSLSVFSNLDSNNYGTQVFLTNSFDYEYNSRLFYDSILNTDFYDRILEDSSVTNESLSFQQLKGFIGAKYKRQKNGSSAISLELGPAVIQNWYKQGTVDTTQLDVLLDFYGNYHSADLTLGGKISYLVNDAYQNNDYELDLSGVYRGFNRFTINAKAYLSNQRPQLDLLRYSSNHVSWNNEFEKYQIQHVMLGASYESLWNPKLSVNYFDIHNPIYFGYDKTPYQALGVAQLIRTSFSVNKHSKRWDLGAQVHYQYQGGYDVFRLPNVLTKINAAFKFKAFKKKMAAAIGAEVTYFSKYESKNFDPVTGQFYIYGNQEVGNYPYMNVFVKSRVQRATFFFMMSHPHQGLLGYDYFYFPGYPANDRFFRLGISWLFVN